MKTIPRAILKAQRLIFSDQRRTIPAHRISLELATEPDQYKVSFTLPNPKEQGKTLSLMERITLTPAEFRAWEAWIDARYPGGRP